MIINERLLLIKQRVSAERHFVNSEPLYSSFTRDVATFSECSLLHNSLMQPHVLKSIRNSSGKISTTEGFYSILSPAYCLYNSYDLFRTYEEVYTDSYPSQSVEYEKRLKYGRFHNSYGTKKLGNTMALDIKIDYARFAGIVDVSQDQTLDFVVCWHQDWNNYWHWHFEVLPRLLLLACLIDKGIFDSSMIRFWVVGNTLSKLQLQTIVLALGFAPSISYVKKGLYSTRLLHVSPPYPSSFHPIVVKALASTLRIAGNPFLGKQKLLIARDVAWNGRKLANSEEVTSILSNKGYRVLNPGAHSYLNQQTSFSSCQSIVCPHGASSVNLIFCNPGTKVIEMHPEDYIHPEPYIMSEALGLDYSFCIGSSLSGQGSESTYNVGIDDLMRLAT